MSEVKLPNPGSGAALELGCLCPVLDNAHGKGWLCSGEFIIRPNCPVHGDEKS